jgi:hypothetical protein
MHIILSLNISFIFTYILCVMHVFIYNLLLKFIKKYHQLNMGLYIYTIGYFVGIVLDTLAFTITVFSSNIKITSD